ncbi:MAG: ChaN family lipoprotein [Cyanobium sp.]
MITSARQPAARIPLPEKPPAIARPHPCNPWALLTLLAGAPALSAPAPAAPPALDCGPALRAAREQQSLLAARARGLEVLQLGEIHTSVADHLWQLETLETLQRAGVPLSLGLEVVPAQRQPVLDRFNAGALDEAAFLREVGWAEVWGHDPALYLPLLRWARRQRVPLLALNTEPELVRRVRREGLAAVPPGQRQGIGQPAPVGEAYRGRLRAAWAGHGGGPMAGDALSPAQTNDLERFIDSQRLRDRAMAERLAAARRRDPGRLVVALIGRGHLENNDGVPAQLRALGLRRTEVLLRPELPAICAPAPRGARLGAYLESTEGAVWVRRVAPGSAAEAAGLRPGDRIVTVNGESVQRAGQVILRVAKQPPGQPLLLTIERQGRMRQLELRLPPPASPGGVNGENGGTPPPAAVST